jgi:hypothetical protein
VLVSGSTAGATRARARRWPATRARSLSRLSSRRRRVRPQALGLQEMGYGLLTLALLALGYRLGW